MTLNQTLSLTPLSLDHGMSVLVPPVPGVVFTTRRGGHSPAPFDSLNLSVATGDDPALVDANRRDLSQALGISPDWETARQVHGCGVLTVHEPAGGAGLPQEADALVVRAPGRPIAVLVADCVPIALVGPGLAAVVHAGWRGLCAGVIEAAVRECRAAGGEAAPPVAWIGPCIGPCCFEVGPEVPAAFAAGHRGAPEFGVRTGGRRQFDLRAAAAYALEAAGATLAGPAGDVPCTSCDPRFFSHRRDARGGGTTGRQALVAWVQPGAGAS